MSDKDTYERKMLAQLAEWRAEIDSWTAKADQAGADAKLEFNRRMDDLQAKQAAAWAKLRDLRGAGDAAWEELKAGVDRAFHEMRESQKAAAEKFKKMK